RPGPPQARAGRPPPWFPGRSATPPARPRRRTGGAAPHRAGPAPTRPCRRRSGGNGRGTRTSDDSRTPAGKIADLVPIRHPVGERPTPLNGMHPLHIADERAGKESEKEVKGLPKGARGKDAGRRGSHDEGEISPRVLPEEEAEGIAAPIADFEQP